MRLLARIDEGLFAAEKAVVSVMLAVMGTVVFLDVVHRVTTRAGSWLAEPAVIVVLLAVLGAAATVTRGRPWYEGAIAGVVLGHAVEAFVRLFPNGVVWSQTFALALTLWMGLIGASLAAHERRHLALDVGSKLWPASLAPKVAALGHVVTAAFCVGVVWLGWRSVGHHWHQWVSTEHASGNLSGLPIPLWTANLAIPYGMAALAFRFLYEAVRTWTGELPLGGDDTLHQLGIDGGKPQ